METRVRMKIELTAEQVEQVRRAAGTTGRAVRLTLEEVEERIAPALIGLLGGNYD